MVGECLDGICEPEFQNSVGWTMLPSPPHEILHCRISIHSTLLSLLDRLKMKSDSSFENEISTAAFKNCEI